jgi:chaperonin cofactor prefoldin
MSTEENTSTTGLGTRVDELTSRIHALEKRLASVTQALQEAQADIDALRIER